MAYVELPELGEMEPKIQKLAQEMLGKSGKMVNRGNRVHY